MKELIDQVKLPLRDITKEQVGNFDSVELKYDGWWSMVYIHDGMGEIWSSGGEMRGVTPAPTGVTAKLIGEWMFGTNWSQHYNTGVVFLHDIVELNGSDLRDMAYITRRQILDPLARTLPHTHFRLVTFYPVSEWMRIREEYCFGELEFEGLVFKHNAFHLRPGADIGRMKTVPTIDYACVGFVEGKGRLQGSLGALLGGIYVHNTVNICRVGGGFTDLQRAEIWANRDKYKMKVFEASGRRLYETGALRHPNFLRWRDDKQAHQCILHRKQG